MEEFDINKILEELEKLPVQERLEKVNRLYRDMTGVSEDNEDTSIKKFTNWKTEATLISITKEWPIRHIVSGISKSRQPFYDTFQGLHGSNGTYAENVNPYWALKIRLKRLSYECNEKTVLFIDIHDYITTQIMPSLGWYRITAKRLEQLNSCIKGKKIAVSSISL